VGQMAEIRRISMGDKKSFLMVVLKIIKVGGYCTEMRWRRSAA